MSTIANVVAPINPTYTPCLRRTPQLGITIVAVVTEINKIKYFIAFLKLIVGMDNVVFP